MEKKDREEEGGEMAEFKVLNEFQAADLTSLSVFKLRKDRSQLIGIPFVRLAGRRVGYIASDIKEYISDARIETRSGKR